MQLEATVAVDTGLINANVRDLQLDVQADTAQSLLESNLTDAGWTQEDGIWVKYNGDKLIYALEDMQASVQEKTLRIDATLVMLSPWTVNGISEIRIHMMVLSSVLYID